MELLINNWMTLFLIFGAGYLFGAFTQWVMTGNIPKKN